MRGDPKLHQFIGTETCLFDVDPLHDFIGDGGLFERVYGPEDIAPLAVHLVDVLSRDLGVPPRPICHDVLDAFERYAWPGNARELRNILERMLLLEDADQICLDHLPPELRGAEVAANGGFHLPPAGLDLEDVERDLICQAIERAAGNKSVAARLLGLSRDTLRYRLEKFGIR